MSVRPMIWTLDGLTKFFINLCGIAIPVLVGREWIDLLRVGTVVLYGSLRRTTQMRYLKWRARDSKALVFSQLNHTCGLYCTGSMKDGQSRVAPSKQEAQTRRRT